MKQWRVYTVVFFIVLFGAALGGRLFYLQIIQHDFYRALAKGQQSIFQISQGERGEIFFRGGELLATNIQRTYLFASPQEVVRKQETAETLTKLLDLDKEILLAKISKQNLFEPLGKDLTQDQEQALQTIDLPGIYIGRALKRKYPQGLVASHVVGFLGGEKQGQYGVEGYYDSVLAGKEGLSLLSTLLSQKSSDVQKGANLFLTLDYHIQFIAEKLLEQAQEELGIEGGQIIVLDPHTGSIVALAHTSRFDPNAYSEIEDFDIFQNGSIQKFFEPGSIMKPITMASAFQEGVITPDTTYIDGGQVKIGNYTIYNYDERVWGKRSMTEVLERSINTGAVFVERQLGHDLFLQYLDKFGFFEPTGIDLQGEVFSKNKELKKGYEINFATASFGQGIEITPMQFVRAFAVIANGGKLVEPFIVDRIVENGTMSQTEPRVSKDQVISQRVSSQVTAMLVSVVENGFAKSARIPGYYIAGKTGTAQIAWSSLGINRRGYSDKTWQSFVGFAPAFDARFIILVKLDNPQTRTAEYSALPIFRELAKYIIDYWEIPPDYE